MNELRISSTLTSLIILRGYYSINQNFSFYKKHPRLPKSKHRDLMIVVNSRRQWHCLGSRQPWTRQRSRGRREPLRFRRRPRKLRTRTAGCCAWAARSREHPRREKPGWNSNRRGPATGSAGQRQHVRRWGGNFYQETTETSLQEVN